MKRNDLIKAICFSILLISDSVNSQVTTPTWADAINCVQNSNGQNDFEVLPLTPSQTGAYYSHLWWSGDNSFSFLEVPQHIHKSSGGNPNFPKVKMSAITTENYGTGGPPPLTYTFTTDIGNASPRIVLPQGMNIYMQTYRNAVINDTMYLIVSYGNPTSSILSGKLRFNVGSHARISNGTLSAHPHFFSNGERWNPSTNECTFSDLRVGEERSILIPVKILQNEEDVLDMTVDFFKENNNEVANPIEGVDFFMISAAVAYSHDPNQMIENSDANNQCDYRNGKIHYTVKFQNEGEGRTSYVRVECQLDDKVDLNSITGIEFPDTYSTNRLGAIIGGYEQHQGAIYSIDRTNRKIVFEMHDLVLQGTGDADLTNLELSRDQVEFDIRVKSNYVFGPATIAQSLIFFDRNRPIETNAVETVCGDPIPIGRGGGFQKKKEIKKLDSIRDRQIKQL